MLPGTSLRIVNPLGSHKKTSPLSFCYISILVQCQWSSTPSFPRIFPSRLLSDWGIGCRFRSLMLPPLHLPPPSFSPSLNVKYSPKLPLPVPIRIQTSNSNSQQIQLEMAVYILKCFRNGFSIIKTYHSHSNSFYYSNVWFLTRLELP